MKNTNTQLKYSLYYYSWDWLSTGSEEVEVNVLIGSFRVFNTLRGQSLSNTVVRGWKVLESITCRQYLWTYTLTHGCIINSSINSM